MELCLGSVLTHMNLTSRHSARISQWKLKGSITSSFWEGKEKIFNLKLEENISSLTKSALRRRYFTRCQIYPLVCFMLLWKSPWPKQIVEKRVYFFLICYGSSLRKVRKGTHSRNFWKMNRNRGHWGKLFPCFASRPMFNSFSHASQSNLPGDGTAHSCLSPLPSLCNQECAPLVYPLENLI